MLHIKTPKTGRARRELKKIAPKLVSSNSLCNSLKCIFVRLKTKGVSWNRYLIVKWLTQVETGKKTLILHGTKTSNVINDVLTEIYHLKKDNAVKYTKRNDNIRPFESGGETSLEFYSLKTDCSLFVVSQNITDWLSFVL